MPAGIKQHDSFFQPIEHAAQIAFAVPGGDFLFHPLLGEERDGTHAAGQAVREMQTDREAILQFCASRILRGGGGIYRWPQPFPQAFAVRGAKKIGERPGKQRLRLPGIAKQGARAAAGGSNSSFIVQEEHRLGDELEQGLFHAGSPRFLFLALAAHDQESRQPRV
jgi:hypothetical protein